MNKTDDIGKLMEKIEEGCRLTISQAEYIRRVLSDYFTAGCPICNGSGRVAVAIMDETDHTRRGAQSDYCDCKAGQEKQKLDS